MDGIECHLAVSDAVIVAALGYEGPALEVGRAFDELVAWANTYRIEQWGPLIGVYYDGEENADLRAELWFPIPPDSAGLETEDRRVTVRTIPRQQMATCTHLGYPDELGNVLATLAEWIKLRNLKRSAPLHRQLYHAAPPGRPADWVVQIQVPVMETGDG